MNIPIDEILAEFSANAGTTENALSAAEKAVGKVLPEDYRQFLLKHNGGEGFIEKHYLMLWKAEELAQFNREYQVQEYAPGLVMFGSSGGGEGFAFDTRTTPYKIVQVPFIGMDLQSAIPVASTFTELLERMLKSDGSLL